MATSSDWTETLSKATARGANVVPGVVSTAVTSSGKMLDSTVSGYNGLSSTAEPLTKDATFWIASCTKLATSIAALQCVEQGLVTLDEPLGKHIPELANKTIISLEGDKVTEKSAEHQITLRHLLTHTAGFSYSWLSPTLGAWRAKNSLPADMKLSVTSACNTPILFEPGHGWAYGTSIDWAGVLVEKLHNTDLGTVLRENIFQRLGSSGESTTFDLDSAEAQAGRIKERLLPNTARQSDGTLIEKAFRIPESSITNSGGGGWYSSVDDYILILQDIIAPEPRLLRKENIEKWLFSGHISNQKALAQLATVQTAMTPTDNGANYKVNYSLGGMLWETDGEVLPKGTLTWGGLPNLKWFANREKGVAAMFATQVTPQGDKLAQDLAARYFKEVWRLFAESEGDAR